MEIQERNEFVINDLFCGEMIFGFGKTKNEAFYDMREKYYKKRRELEDKLQRYIDYEEVINTYCAEDPECGLPFQDV